MYNYLKGAIFGITKKYEIINSEFNKTNNFTGYHWLKKNISNNNSNILNSACYTKIYKLNFIQLTALAKAAYLTGEIDKEQNIINAFKKSIFSEEDEDNIKIKNMTFLQIFRI